MRIRRVAPPLSVVIVGADRVGNANLARALVESCTVVCASDAPEIAAAAARSWDVVLIDDRMAFDPTPGLRTLLEHAARIVVTNCVDAERTSRACAQISALARVIPLRPGTALRDIAMAVATSCT